MPKKPSEMTQSEAVQELSTLKGMYISDLLGEPEIFMSARFVKALEMAREALGRPERQVTYMEETGGEPFEVTLDRQCMSCGTPCGDGDNYCSNCGRRFFKEVRR